MNLTGILCRRPNLYVLFLSFLFIGFAGAQQQSPPKVPERLIFSAEEERFENSVPLSLEAKRALATDESIVAALREEGFSAETIPANWFTAAVVHLADPKRDDLVVMGNEIGRGAYTSMFLILSASEPGYRIVFRTDAHDLEILPGRSKGLCNLLTAVVTLRYNSTDEYRFDGKRYKVARRTLQPNGLEVTIDPQKFTNRKLFIQGHGQDSETVRAEARAWTWQQWQARRPCYVQIATKEEDGESDSVIYATDKDQDGEWQIRAKSRRKQWEPNSHDRNRYLVEKNELAIAAKIERIEPMEDDSQSPRVIPDTDVRPASGYQLNFVDDADFSVSVL